MLKELKIKNGNMSLKFDPLNTIYTIMVEANETYLDIEYVIDQEDRIEIQGNDLKQDKNEVIITVISKDKTEDYHLYVYKKEQEVGTDINQYSSLDIPKQEVWEYAVPIISVSCFLIILFSFVLLFRKRKKKN